MIFLDDNDIRSLISSNGFGFKLEEDEIESYDYDFSNILSEMRYSEHPLRLYWIFTCSHKLTKYSSQDVSSIQSWYLIKDNFDKKVFFTTKTYAVFTPHYITEESNDTPKILVDLKIIQKFMIGMQREFPDRFSNPKLKRVIGLNI